MSKQLDNLLELFPMLKDKDRKEHFIELLLLMITENRNHLDRIDAREYKYRLLREQERLDRPLSNQEIVDIQHEYF